MIFKKAQRLSWLLAALLCLPISVQALGFGVPVLKSHLNEMLLVEVPLFLADDESFSDLRIAFAKADEYRRVGLEPYTDLAGLRVTVKHAKGGGLYLELSSVYAIQSPMMSLLLKARLGHNTHYKHIQLFFDIQNTQLRKPASKKKHPSNTIAVKTEKETLPKSEQGWARTWRYGPIHSGESLSVIAYRLRRSSTWSKEDIALALYRFNPDAFIQHDMNKLKAGVWLKVPHEPELKKLLKQAPTIYETSKEKAPRFAKKVTVKKKNTIVKAKQAHQAHYVGHVSLGDKAVEVAVVKDDHNTPNEHALRLEKRLEQLYQQSLQDHAQMKSLNQNLRIVRDDLSELGKEIIALKQQPLLLRGQALQKETAIHYWMWFFLLLCLINIVAIGIYLYSRYREQINEALATEVFSFEKKVDDVPPKRKKNQTTRLLENKIYDIENHLNNQNYQAAEDIFEQLSQMDKDHFAICALQARLYHETARERERDSLIAQKRDSLSATKWNLLCDRLPISLWHALNESGVIEGSGDLFHGTKEEGSARKVDAPLNEYDGVLEMDLSADEQKSLEQLKMEITQIMEIPDFVQQSEEDKDADTTGLPGFTPFPNAELQSAAIQNIDALDPSPVEKMYSSGIADPLSLHDLEFDLTDDTPDSSDGGFAEANETLAPAERDALKFLQMTQVSEAIKQDVNVLKVDEPFSPREAKAITQAEKGISTELPHVKDADKTFDPLDLDDIAFDDTDQSCDNPEDINVKKNTQTNSQMPESSVLDSMEFEVIGEALLSSELHGIEFEPIADKTIESDTLSNMEFEVMGEALQSSELHGVAFEIINKQSETMNKPLESSDINTVEFEVIGDALQSSELFDVEFEKLGSGLVSGEHQDVNNTEALKPSFAEFDILDDIEFENIGEEDIKPSCNKAPTHKAE